MGTEPWASSTLELAVQVLDRERAQLVVEDAADLDAIVGVRIDASAGSDQEATGAETMVTDGRVVVVGVAQYEAHLPWQLVEQARGRSLSAVLAGVSSAASGIQTDAMVVARWSFQP